MIVGEKGALATRLDSCVVHMGCGEAFTVWERVSAFRRVWQRAMARSRLIEVHGSRRVCLNPGQIVMVEGRR